MESIESVGGVLGRIRGCRICEAHLPRGPRPVVRISAVARLLIVGQAPGIRVHETGLPWNDASGDRLRQWLGVDRETFYDDARIAIMPMGFCYPGTEPKGGDCPPRPECAPLWHTVLWRHLAAVRLTLLVGGYAQAYYLRRPESAFVSVTGRSAETMTETVAAWRRFLPTALPLPHPSWRNTAWLRRNPWFEAELLPPLRQRVADLL